MASGDLKNAMQNSDGDSQIDSITEREKLRQLYNLQRRSGENFVHNSMSPLSAISGYLELMELGIEADLPKKKLQDYRTKIERGVNELGFILEQMQELFSRESTTLMSLNADWVIEEVKSKLHNSSRFRGQVLSVVGNNENLYVKGDPFQMKTVVYNLLMVSARYADQNKPIEISARHKVNSGEIYIRFHSETLGDRTLEYFKKLIQRFDEEPNLKRSDELKILISSKYAREMNGDLELKSKDSTEYEFKLRLKAAD